MKKIYIIIGILSLAISSLFAQMPANRTTSTIVADMLAQSPYDKQSDYDTAMEVLFSTKEEGVLQLIGMMKAPADGDNAKMEYALSGLTFYAGKADNEAKRLTVANAYIKALSTTTERETLAFIIRQLEIVGGNEAIPALTKYLANESLAGPAARALAANGSSAAEKALLDALRASSSNQIKGDLVNALGFMKSTTAEEAVRKLLNSGDSKLQQTVVQNLGVIGTKASLKDLAKLAKEANYVLDHNSATGAYLALIEKLIKDGEVKEAEKAAKNLTNDAKKALACGTRIAALNLWLQANPAEAVKEATKALKEDNSRFRLEALRAAARVSKGDTLSKEVMTAYAKANEATRIDIAGWIEEEAKCSAKRASLLFTVEPLISNLASTNVDEQKAVAKALVVLQDTKAINPLVELLCSDNKASVDIAKNALANFKGEIASPIVSKLASSNDYSTVAMLDLLALRKSSKYLSEVIKLTNTGSDEVKDAAFRTLKDVVEAKDINSMYSLLEAADAKYVPAIQNAVIAALNYMPANKRYDEISTKVAKTSDSKKYLYYTALASTKDAKALDTILEGFNKGNKAQKDAAFDAIASWDNIVVANQLMAICKDPASSVYFDRAMDAYIKVSSNEALSGSQRTSYLVDAMEVAKTDKQRSNILKQIQKAGTFQGLIFAGQFLDDKNKEVQQSAAQAVMNIALGNKDFVGSDVEALLNKVLDVLDNPDAGYQKEGIKKHLREVPMKIEPYKLTEEEVKEGFEILFDGTNMDKWTGNTVDYRLEHGLISLHPSKRYGGNLYTKEQFDNFVYRFEFMLTPGANNGVGIRTPMEGDAAYVGMEIQILDHDNPIYSKITPLQVHGSVYGVIGAKRAKLKPEGEWNYEEIIANGDNIKVILNGEVILEGNLKEAMKNGAADGKNHPGVKNKSGHIAFLGHGNPIKFKNIRIKRIK